MDNVFFCITMVEEAAVGKFTGKPEGVTNDAVSIKNINNRNTMSVIDDMLKEASTLCFDLISIIEALVISQ